MPRETLGYCDFARPCAHNFERPMRILDAAMWR
jgi:hypothetical protein